MEAETQMDTEPGSQARRWPLKAAVVIVVLGLAAAATWSQLANGEVKDRVIARTDDLTLKQSDVRALLADLDATSRERVLEDKAALAAVVRRELSRRLLQQRALGEGWDRRDDVKAKLERLRLDVITTSYLEAQAMPPATFPSDAEVETAYHLNQQRLLVPRQFHVAQIYVRRPADKSEADKARSAASAVAAEVQKKPDRFAEVAGEKSHDTVSGARGGDLGWLPEDQIQPAIRAAIAGMGPGEISDAIETADGWHILRMVETKPAGVPPLEQVRAALVSTLRQQRTQENAAAFVAKLVNEKQVAVDEIALAEAQKDLH